MHPINIILIIIKALDMSEWKGWLNTDEYFCIRLMPSVLSPHHPLPHHPDHHHHQGHLASCHSSLTGGGGQGLVDTRPLDRLKDLQTLVERHL